MTRRADFNAEDWARIVEGPVLAGLRVASAGRGGTLRESMAMGKVYAEVRRHHGESELLDGLVATAPAVDSQGLQQRGEIGVVCRERLRQAVALLEPKASPEEVVAYKRFVLDVAEAAARAHKEGGFIGIGGREVSEDEQAALDEIVSILDLERP